MEAQVQKLLEAITTMTMAMRQQNESAASTTSVNVLSCFEHFDPKVESFRNYREWLEIHFPIKKLHSDREMCANF